MINTPIVKNACFYYARKYLIKGNSAYLFMNKITPSLKNVFKPNPQLFRFYLKFKIMEGCNRA